MYERNPAGSTYGWGVTYWAGLLDKLRAGDPESAAAVAEASVTWTDGVAIVRDERTVHRGDAGFGIGRRRMLALLADRAEELGVRVAFEHDVTGRDAPELADADLVVAADGVNSVLREAHADHFGGEVTAGRNQYIWLGTTKVFDSFSFAFKETEHGWIWCYAYGFSGERSTCVVECSPETWTGLGLDTSGETDSLRLLEKLFHDLLDGHELIGRERADDAAQWLTFRTLTNRVWHRGNLVLLGDAAHTTHYSIGAGTTLALEDALALADALRAPDALRTPMRPRRRPHHVREAAPRRARLGPERGPVQRPVVREPASLHAAGVAQMFALLGQRHSPLLPHIPPQLYYRIDRAAGQLEALRRLKRWLGPRVARAVHGRR